MLGTGIKMAASGELLKHILASLSRVLWGFGIAAGLGVVVGTALGRSRLLEHLVEPTLEMLRPIPPLAFLPMMVLWFGIGEASKVAFIAYAAFFPVFTTTVEGIKYVDPVLVRAAASLGASERQIFWHVVLPAATPNILTGLRLAFGLSFFVIVAAEFIAADSGLGFLINDARTFFLVSNMLLGAAVIGIIGVLANVCLRRARGPAPALAPGLAGTGVTSIRLEGVSKSYTRGRARPRRGEPRAAPRTASPVCSGRPAAASPRC